MRTVVVGGQGFLGGAIVADLLARGDGVTVFDQMADSATCDAIFGPGSVRVVRGDIGDPAALQMAFKDAEEVYHLAGVLGTSELEDSVLGAIHGNVIGAVNVFDAAIACRVPVVFFPSKPNVWLNTYTVTKYAAEQFARLYTMHRSVRIPSLRYFNAYGPRQSIVPIRKLVPTFAVQAMKGLPLTVYGEGDQMVDLIFSVDLARLTVDFTRACFDGEPLDCGRGLPVSVMEIATAVNDFFDNQAGVLHLPMRRGEIAGTLLVADREALEQVVGPRTFTDFDESLSTTLRWYASRTTKEIEHAAASLLAA
ncbi:MAG: NAD-dependent epimerase/dehydratase family protein [Nocardioidaceae bacterium]|nr:NAD-dependent epimerase/dehydratase family protein [Nocardioidaceae bacterium]